MIFATVGTQLPFDRLMQALNRWASENREQVVAQVGPTKEKFDHLECHPYLPHTEVERLYLEARVVVAHAGMGSVLMALKHRKPLVIMPRIASSGEHRNEHQKATAKWLQSVPGIYVAWDEDQLIQLLDSGFEEYGSTVADHAQPEFIQRLKEYIQER